MLGVQKHLKLFLTLVWRAYRSFLLFLQQLNNIIKLHYQQALDANTKAIYKTSKKIKKVLNGKMIKEYYLLLQYFIPQNQQILNHLASIFSQISLFKKKEESLK